MPIKVTKIIKNLTKKGFESRENDHLYLVYYNMAGKKTIVNTKISHGEKEVGDNLAAIMARQLKLTRIEFNDFVECDIDRNGYEMILKNKRVIT